MIIELWTLKKSGKSKGKFTFWKQFECSHENIPSINQTIIYTNKNNKSYNFTVSNIEFEYKASLSSFRVQLCVKEVRT